MKRLALWAIPLICFVACQQSHQPLSPTATVSAAATARPAPAAAPAPSVSKTHTKPLINPESTGGVRGAQMVTFVVTADTNAAKGATVLVAGTGSRLKDENMTDDWGEYHTSLTPGSYRVKVTWGDRTLSRTVRIDADTQEIDLKLDTPPS
jgi:hypothetical protein